jgi:hypothetical protein
VNDELRAFAHRLFVAPRSAWPLAIARAVIGLSILLWALTMAFDVTALLGEDAIVGPEFADDLHRYLPLDSAVAVNAALAALVVASLAIIVGWRPPFWLVVAFVLLVAIQRRNPTILNSGDIILRNLTLLLALTATGAAMSVDRMRRHGRHAFWTSAQVAPWGLRLVQLQMVVVYFFAFWSKSGELWQNGTAVSTAFRLQDLQRIGEWSVLGGQHLGRRIPDTDRFPNHGAVWPRRRLDAALIDAAAAAGADIRFETEAFPILEGDRVIGVEARPTSDDRTVTGPSEKFEAGLTVVAAGPPGQVGRMLGATRVEGETFGLAIRTYAETRATATSIWKRCCH